MSCHLTDNVEVDGRGTPRRFRIVDKHGLSRHAYNLQIEINLEGRSLSLGLDETQLPGRAAAQSQDSGAARPAGAPSAEELFDDLASMLKKRSAKTITED
jgi:hypothetical protein